MTSQNWVNYYISRKRSVGPRPQVAVGIPVAEVIASFPPSVTLLEQLIEN